jgi:hypothetical protein
MLKILLLPAFLLILLPAEGWALRRGPIPGDRLNVVTTELDRGYSPAEMELARTIARDLRRKGYQVDVAIDSRVRSSQEHDYILEIAFDGRTTHYGDVGAATSIGSVGVGASWDIASSRISATITLFDAVSLDVVDEWKIDRSLSASGISSVSVGDRHGFLWLNIPVRRSPHRAAIRAVAHEVIASLSGE